MAALTSTLSLVIALCLLTCALGVVLSWSGSVPFCYSWQQALYLAKTFMVEALYNYNLQCYMECSTSHMYGDTVTLHIYK